MTLPIANLGTLRDNLSDLTKGFVGRWTIYETGTQNEICYFDSFEKFAFLQKNGIVQYPIEQGSFATYNKLNNPANIGVVLTKSGFSINQALDGLGAFSKEKFIDDLSVYTNGTTKVDIVTPSKTFLGYSIESMTYTNSVDEGADILLVTLEIKEIRELIATLDTIALAPKNANSYDTVDGGLRIPTESKLPGIL
jgi:hypothetical protein